MCSKCKIMTPLSTDIQMHCTFYCIYPKIVKCRHCGQVSSTEEISNHLQLSLTSKVIHALIQLYLHAQSKSRQINMQPTSTECSHTESHSMASLGFGQNQQCGHWWFSSHLNMGVRSKVSLYWMVNLTSIASGYLFYC